MTTADHANTINAFTVFPGNISNAHPIIAHWPPKLVK